MRQFPLDDLEIAPGHVLEWSLRRRDADREGVEGRSSFNQLKHYQYAAKTRSDGAGMVSWIAITFELAGPFDQAALEAAFRLLARRHDVLRCEFHRLAADLSCHVHDAADVELQAEDVGPFATTADLRAHLGARFRTGIDTLGWPLYLMGAVVRDGAPTTVFLAFDHIVCDGMSMPHVINDLQLAYTGFAAGLTPELPPTSGYSAFAADQRRRYVDFPADDERLGYWRAFVERAGAFFPPHSLDLGIEPGRLYPTVNTAGTLLDAAEVAALEDRCGAVGGTFFLGLLGAVAVSLRKEGGPPVYRGLMPVSERGRGDWENAVGWFVNTLPIEFVAEADMGLAELVGEVRAAFTEMMTSTDVPFVRAWQLLEPESFATHAWPYAVNFFSYTDTTRFPGSRHHPLWRPGLHTWTSRSNGSNSWFLRDRAGLHVNHLYSDTPRARRVMARLARTLQATLREMIGAQPAEGAIPTPRDRRVIRQ